MNAPAVRTSSSARRALVVVLLIGYALVANAVGAEDGAPDLTAPFDSERAVAAQRRSASQLRAVIELRNSIGMTMTLIPAGAFRMGSPESAANTAAFAVAMGLKKAKAEDYADEHPQHLVRITRAFRLARHEVTRANFAEFVNETGYRTEAESDDKGGWGWDADQKRFVQDRRFDWRNTGFSQEDDHPVVNVSWNDALRFCEWLGKKESRMYRLPTEAEWEFANRAGTESRYQCGDDPEGLAVIANVADGTSRASYPDWPAITAKDGFTYTAPVGSFRPNAFGLYDLHGNVWEWCADYYDPAYYASSPVDDPAGPATAKLRVSRGGAWSRTPVNCRSSVRRGGDATLRHINIGFRPVLESPTN